MRPEGREPLPDKAGESSLLSRSGGEKGLRGGGIWKPSHTDLYVLGESSEEIILVQLEYYFYKKRDIKLKLTFKFKAPMSIRDVFSLEEGKLFPICSLKSPEYIVLRIVTTRLWSLNTIFHQND